MYESWLVSAVDHPHAVTGACCPWPAVPLTLVSDAADGGAAMLWRDDGAEAWYLDVYPVPDGARRRYVTQSGSWVPVT